MTGMHYLVAFANEVTVYKAISLFQVSDLPPPATLRLKCNTTANYLASAIVHEVTVNKAPPPTLKWKPKSAASQCKKHSKCHCQLFSQQVEGFFAVTK